MVIDPQRVTDIIRETAQLDVLRDFVNWRMTTLWKRHPVTW